MNVLITSSNSKWSLHQDVIRIGYYIVIFTIQKHVMRLRRKAGIIPCLVKPTFCQLHVATFVFVNQWSYLDLHESKFMTLRCFKQSCAGNVFSRICQSVILTTRGGVPRTGPQPWLSSVQGHGSPPRHIQICSCQGVDQSVKFITDCMHLVSILIPRDFNLLPLPTELRG